MKAPYVRPTNHTGLILFGGTALIALRLFESGKLKRAWSTAISGTGTPPKRTPVPTSSSGGSLPPGGAIDITPGPGTGGTTGLNPGFPPDGYFLNQRASSHLSGFSVPGVRALDSSGIQAAGGSFAYSDWDYGVPTGTPVHLPGGTSYRVLPSWEPGRTVIVSPTSGPGKGGIIEFLHLSADYVTNLVRSVLQGGTVVGRSGSPQGPMEAGSGAHLAVVTDPIAGKWLSGE